MAIEGSEGNDTINGTSGDDDIKAKGGNDSVNAGAGADKVDGGEGNDTIYGGSGEDDLKGENGDDLIDGGDQNDKIDGGTGEDTLYGGTGDDDIKGGDDDDLIYGGAGNDDIDATHGYDTVYGEGGNDTIKTGGEGGTAYGGEGNDSIKGGSGDLDGYGGAGDDYLEGGSGEDRFEGGEGDDTIKTGSGNDVVVFSDGDGNDTITQFDDQDDSVEITSAGITSYADVQARMTKVDGDTRITLDDGSTLLIEGLEPDELSASNFTINMAPICMCAGTMILTARGERPIETLREGDMVMTADHGFRRIRMILRRRYRFKNTPHGQKPILIEAGALGHGIPSRPLEVSPQHRILLDGAAVQRMYQMPEVFAAAKMLTRVAHVRQMMRKQSVRYFNLVLDRHEVIFANGARAESFFPGPMALQMIGDVAREELFRLFPALRHDLQKGYGPKARRSLTRTETDPLIRTHQLTKERLQSRPVDPDPVPRLRANGSMGR